jgi:hypothetical protein
MSHAREMLEASPRTPEFDIDELVAAIDACLDCEQSCTACADADVAEPDVTEMRRCIGLCLDCADICSTTARVLSRETRYDSLLVQRLLEACVRACASCGEECERHAAHHAHCRVCMEVCRTCERACHTLLAAQALVEVDALRGG